MTLPRLLCAHLAIATAIATTAIATTAIAQPPRPEALPYVRKLPSIDKLNGLNNLAVSPDGRWLAADGSTDARHIWLVRLQDGNPVQVTTGTTVRSRPVWFRSGNRLAFVSGETRGLMVIDINPTTGRAVGAPRRVTLDTISGAGYDVSPDGSSIAYVTGATANTRALRIVPSRGGVARTVPGVSPTGNGPNVRYSSDGRSIYFLELTPAAATGTAQRERLIRRVSLADNSVTTVARLGPTTGGVAIDARAGRILVRRGDEGLVMNLRGDSVASFRWASGFPGVAGFAFSADGATLYAAGDATVTVTKALPLDGGPLRLIGFAGKNEWPFERVGDRYYYWPLPDTGVVNFTSVDGRTRGSVAVNPPDIKPTPQSTVVVQGLSPDGRYFLVVVSSRQPIMDWPVYVYDSQTRTSRKLADAVARTVRLREWNHYASNGTHVRGDTVFYAVERDGAIEVHADLFRGGMARRVAVIPRERYRVGGQADPAPSIKFTVASDRVIVHVPVSGDTLAFDVAVGGGAPRRLATLSGVALWGSMSLSPDARTLYADAVIGAPNDPTRRIRSLFLPIAADGSAGTPRWVDLPEEPEQMGWVADSRSVLTLLWNDAGRTSIWRIPATGTQPPQRMPQGQPVEFWNVAFAPDGREVMIPVEEGHGTYLWSIDLRAAGRR